MARGNKGNVEGQSEAVVAPGSWHAADAQKAGRGDRSDHARARRVLAAGGRRTDRAHLCMSPAQGSTGAVQIGM